MLVYCTKCGHKVSTTAVACPGCGAPPYRAGNPTKEVTQVARTVTPSAATWQQPSRPQVVIVASQKSAGLAAVLSALLPGLGQIYNGSILKGAVLMIVSVPGGWFGLSLMFWGSLVAVNGKPDDPRGAIVALLGLAALVAAPIIWIYSIVNAYRTAERINRRQIATY